jgi:hypothetical protein
MIATSLPAKPGPITREFVRCSTQNAAADIRDCQVNSGSGRNLHGTGNLAAGRRLEQAFISRWIDVLQCGVRRPCKGNNTAIFDTGN